MVGACSSANRPAKDVNSTTASVEPTIAPLSVTPARFNDVSRRAGLTEIPSSKKLGAACLLSEQRLRHEFSKTTFHFDAAYAKQSCIPEHMSAGVAVGDYDSDGWPDMYFTRQDGAGVLYRNTHVGTFGPERVARGIEWRCLD